MKKIIITTTVVIALVVLGLYFYSQLAFTGTFDKSYTREELTKNFIENEAFFLDLVSYFTSNIQQDSSHTIEFGRSKGDKVSLSIYPIVIDPKNRILGGDNLKLDSKALDSAIVALGWTAEVVKNLKDKLSKTNCDWIRTTDIHGKPIEIYPTQKGWSSFAYRIYVKPILESQIPIYGKPIGKSEFGKRVVLNYRSAL